MSAAMGLSLLGTQERVRNSRGKRAISVRASEVLLYSFFFYRPWRNCLSDPVDLFDREEFLEFMSTYPGQDLTPNQQCQDILGLDSYYGWVSDIALKL